MGSDFSAQTDMPIAPCSAVRGTPGEVFAAFLKLGLTAFGGPVAHLGYFREELIVRRGWMDEASYADLVALCQFLPGPASSQVGFSLGLLRGGPLGAIAAWCAFTLPSAILLVLFATAAAAFTGPIGQGAIHGLKLTAVAIVAQAVWGMARTLTPDRSRAAIAFLALVTVSLLGGAVGQVVAILAGSLSGIWLCRTVASGPVLHLHVPVSRKAGVVALAVFAALLLGLPPVAFLAGAHGLTLFDVFYRSGALVFGGGHVVLPLLQTAVVQPGWINPDRFLAGYGAAQAVPGPLFTFAAFLGAAMTPLPNGVAGAAICLIAIFLPGLLLVVGILPFWGAFRTRPLVQAAMRGANAVVVGILAAALYNPLWTTTIQGKSDFVLALAGFLLLAVWKAPPWIVVVLMTVAACVLAASP